jgi:hypothetical protein
MNYGYSGVSMEEPNSDALVEVASISKRNCDYKREGLTLERNSLEKGEVGHLLPWEASHS